VGVALLALVLAAPCLAAQDTEALLSDLPPRPALPKGEDRNDWRSHFDHGIRIIQRNPSEAAAHFWWASRLNPQSPEPVHARWVALLVAKPALLDSKPARGSAHERELARIDSVLLEALTMDPFTPRQYSRYVYEVAKGYWGGDDFTQGYLAYTEGRYDRAAKLLAYEVKGRHARRARYYRALSFHAAERYDSVAAELAALAELAARENQAELTLVYESAAVFHYGVGMAVLQLGDTAGARQALMRALEEDVAMATAHAALARLALARGDTTEALGEWTMALALRPRSGAMHGDYGTALDAMRRREEAITAFERAIELEPEWAAPYFNQALNLDRLGRRDAAKVRYAQFVERAPKALEVQIRFARERLALP
jgi:Tfp pilus assembly protein PilF